VKTAVSLPDELFKKAELVAKRMHVSRSELYALALSGYLRTRDEEEIARKLREFYDKEPAIVDEVLHRAQLRVMKRSEW
jgi:metal-responsive CopG/Arc/MetJ family transcriptional regulator